MRESLLWDSLFALALAYFESTVVIYLREIYYPLGGDLFPLRAIDTSLFRIELGRELSALILIFVFAFLRVKGQMKSRNHVLYRFAYIFGLWDLFYYLWLWLLIGWPPSLLTWDVLFLIPILWVSPVLAPCLVSVVLVKAGILGVRGLKRREINVFSTTNTLLLFAGAFLLFLSFIWVPLSWFLEQGVTEITEKVPSKFPWWLFTLGYVLFSYSLLRPLLPKGPPGKSDSTL